MRVIAVSLVALAAGCWGEYTYRSTTPTGTATVTVATPPPAPIVETPPPAPSSSSVWVAGNWDWTGGRYVWVGGRWSTPPNPGVVYYPPTWERRGQVWQKSPGRWVSEPTHDRYGRRVWIDGFGRRHYY